MDTRHLIAYALIALLVIAGVASVIRSVRKRREYRRVMQGRKRWPKR